MNWVDYDWSQLPVHLRTVTVDKAQLLIATVDEVHLRTVTVDKAQLLIATSDKAHLRIVTVDKALKLHADEYDTSLHVHG